jgi:hypothetical protein
MGIEDGHSGRKGGRKDTWLEREGRNWERYRDIAALPLSVPVLVYTFLCNKPDLP